MISPAPPSLVLAFDDELMWGTEQISVFSPATLADSAQCLVGRIVVWTQMHLLNSLNTNQFCIEW